MKTSAHSWEHEPLFRVMAFLDNTGVQLFNLADEVDVNGNFVHPEKTFALGTPMHAILLAGLDALRGNIRAFFADAEEQKPLLQVTGTGNIKLPENNTLVDETDAKDGEKKPDLDNVLHAATAWEALSSLPPHTEWAANLLQPKSFSDFSHTFEDGFPLPLLLRLKEAFGLLYDSGPVFATPYPLAEQFLIDALDRWMLQRPVAENNVMVLACGVEPSIVEVTRAKEDRTPTAFVDFVVDVVFPVSSTEAPEDAAPLDWLILSYVKNHESVDVDTEETPSADEDNETNSIEGGAPMGMRHDSISQPETNGLRGWKPDDDEVYLSETNLEEYMRDKPSLVPHEILVKARKSWQDPTITMFELENHYSVAELRAIVKKLAALSQGPPSELDALEANLQHPVPPGLLKQASAANNKSSYVCVLMALHYPLHTGQQCLGENASDVVLDSSFKDYEKDKSSEKEIVLGTDSDCTQVDRLNIEDPSLSSMQLVRHFKLQELKDYLVHVLMEPNVARTKRQCANLIVKKRQRCE